LLAGVLMCRHTVGTRWAAWSRWHLMEKTHPRRRKKEEFRV